MMFRINAELVIKGLQILEDAIGVGIVTASENGGKLIWERPGIRAPINPELLAKLADEGWKWFTYENEDGTPVENGRGYFYIGHIV